MRPTEVYFFFISISPGFKPSSGFCSSILGMLEDLGAMGGLLTPQEISKKRMSNLKLN
jgi:hypothetical protein